MIVPNISYSYNNNYFKNPGLGFVEGLTDVKYIKAYSKVNLLFLIKYDNTIQEDLDIPKT